MQNPAQIQAAIEVCQLIFLQRTVPADKVIKVYFRDRRYIGAKDKRAISMRVYMLLRRMSRYERVTGENARLLMILLLRDEEGLSLSDLHFVFAGGMYSPPELTEEEINYIKTPLTFTKAEELALPEALHEYFVESMSTEMCKELAEAYLTEGSFDLRVNAIKSTREAAMAVLMGEGFDVSPTPHSPFGIRFKGRQSLEGHHLFKDGIVDVQDEGSQLIALSCEASAKMAVLDYCAGAGGKTLALAAAMQNKGQLFACDIHEWRLNRARDRLRRASIHNVRFNEANDSKFLKRHQNFFDRVLVDAPCSGTGTWRRNPDMKFKTTQRDINELQVLQRSILSKVAPLVKSGGWLVYATCSVFKRENQDQIAWFLENNPDFRLITDERPEDEVDPAAENDVLPVEAIEIITDSANNERSENTIIVAKLTKPKKVQKSVFYANLSNTLPKVDGANNALGLQLLPNLHGTDGFFMSILVKI
ncbi:MAG: RsmB/NOP family class I SAM-dependent RNA methyltransferase [Candidatus Paracaedibacteraceae bacterium]|nr:RsmB/NOP family class I SAM-dependent RNA methyltransferase [Candidatus Paracaedibacteraceae bacterium]